MPYRLMFPLAFIAGLVECGHFDNPMFPKYP
jgi:hypothetical protein